MRITHETDHVDDPRPRETKPDDERGFGLAPIKPERTEPYTADEMESARLHCLFEDVYDYIRSEVCDTRDDEQDLATPIYQWLQMISGQVSRAQGGQGPMRDRYIKIAALAIRAIYSIDRKDPPPFRG